MTTSPLNEGPRDELAAQALLLDPSSPASEAFWPVVFDATITNTHPHATDGRSPVRSAGVISVAAALLVVAALGVFALTRGGDQGQELATAGARSASQPADGDGGRSSDTAAAGDDGDETPAGSGDVVAVLPPATSTPSSETGDTPPGAQSVASADMTPTPDTQRRPLRPTPTPTYKPGVDDPTPTATPRPGRPTATPTSGIIGDPTPTSTPESITDIVTELIIGDWANDSGTTYIPNSKDLAPRRFRQTLSIRDGGSASYLVLAPDDGHFNVNGTWQLINDRAIAISVTSQDRTNKRWESLVGEVIFVQILDPLRGQDRLELDAPYVSVTIRPAATGFFIADDAGTRICPAVAKSSPPRCSGTAYELDGDRRANIDDASRQARAAGGSLLTVNGVTYSNVHVTLPLN